MSTETQPKVKKKIGALAWVAIAFAALSFLLAVIPGAFIGAFIFILPAFILSIIAVAKKGTAKLIPVIALVLSVVAGIAAPISMVASFANAVNNAIDDTTASVDEAKAKIGETVTTKNGLDFTVSAVACGLTEAPNSISGLDAIPAQGQFCQINFSVKNSGTKEATLFANFVGGLIGKVQYAADSGSTTFEGDNGISITLNPGLSVNGVAYVDIPKDGALEAITFTEGPLGNEVAVLNQ